MRGEGHQSWVSDVAFDPWKCDANVYRFASVGEDTRLLVWEVNVNALHRPRAVRTNAKKLCAKKLNSTAIRLRPLHDGFRNDAQAVEPGLRQRQRQRRPRC